MNKLVKKSLAMLICFTFIFLTVTSSTALDVQKQDINFDNSGQELTTTTEKVTLYRHGLDGTITPVEIEVNLEEGQDLEDAIMEKGMEILDNDPEMRGIIDELKNITFGAFVTIKSKGKGLHYKTLLLEKLILRFWQWKLILPRIALFIAKPLVLCIYNNNEAYTNFSTIAPTKLIYPFNYPPLNKLFWRQNRTEQVDGPHLVVVNSFIGFTSWMGRFVITPLKIREPFFFGYGRFVVIRKGKL